MIDRRVEALRVATLADYALMDTPAEAMFDAMTDAAAAATGAPIAAISLVDDKRQWFKAKTGTDLAGSPIAESFCAAAVRSDEALFTIEDASSDARFRDYPNVVGEPHVRFYAGAALQMRNGARIGTLCVIDVEPRPALDDDERRMLAALASRTVAAFELRRDLRDSGLVPEPSLAGDAVWLDQAGELLAKAGAALEHVAASLPLAHLDVVISEVGRLRAGRAPIQAS